MTHDTQSARISQKQDEPDIYIYIYTYMYNIYNIYNIYIYIRIDRWIDRWIDIDR